MNQSIMNKKERQSEKQLAKDILYVGFGEDTSTDDSERYYIDIHKSSVKMYIMKPEKDTSKKVCCNKLKLLTNYLRDICNTLTIIPCGRVSISGNPVA